MCLSMLVALGAYAWILERKSNHVVAFEPGQAHYQYLRWYPLGSGIDLVKAAVGSRAESVKLLTPGDDTDARHSATVSADNPIVNSVATVCDTVQQVILDEYLTRSTFAGGLLT